MKSKIFFFSSSFPSSVSSVAADNSDFAADLSFLFFLIENSATFPPPDPPCSPSAS